MDTTLIGVTLLSLAMAAALSVIVWRMLRDERARSDARVAILATMAAPPAAPRPPDLPLRQAPATGAVGTMFSEPEHASPWGNRVAVMVALALVLTSAVLFALAAGGTRTSAREAGAANAPAGAASDTGLELLSLRDARQADTLTITGLVRNPRTGSSLSRVTVTAYTFDDTGSFLASGRALLDVTTFAAGDESPFVVTVPVTATVARYRIGFRTEDGRIISHVDKRQQASIQ